MRLNGVAEKLANVLTETFTKTINITLDLKPGLPAINGDENQLHQSLLNLCINGAMPCPKAAESRSKPKRFRELICDAGSRKQQRSAMCRSV